jgi:hypothetical protein
LLHIGRRSSGIYGRYKYCRYNDIRKLLLRKRAVGKYARQSNDNGDDKDTCAIIDGPRGGFEVLHRIEERCFYKISGEGRFLIGHQLSTGEVLHAGGNDPVPGLQTAENFYHAVVGAPYINHCSPSGGHIRLAVFFRR